MSVNTSKPSLQVPAGRLLLHACCAPCSGAIVEELRRRGCEVTVFYSNSNICPVGEYERRRDECRRYALEMEAGFVEDPYCHERWLEAVRGLESEPERGARCSICFRERLLRAARYAAGAGFDILATTLASSRWKNLDQVNAAGEWACAQVDGVEFWAANFRKGGLQERRGEIIRERGFYNQNWCGCEFSARQRVEDGGSPSGPCGTIDKK